MDHWIVYHIFLTGDSGVVYRGYFKTQAGKQLVAIKTCKGTLRMLSGRS